MNVRSRGGLERTCAMGARRGWRDVSIDAARRRMFECCVLAHQRRRCVRRRTIRTCFEGVCMWTESVWITFVDASVWQADVLYGAGVWELSRFCEIGQSFAGL